MLCTCDDEVFVFAIGQGRIGLGMAAIEWKVLFVVSVEPNSPAWNAGIRDGDFIVAFNGVSVESSDDLFKMLTEEKIGIFQDLTVIRQDKKIDLRVYAGGGADACVMLEAFILHI